MCQTEDEIVVEKELDRYCETASIQVGQTNAKFNYDGRRLLIRISIVYNAVQMVIPELQLNRIVFLSHSLQMEKSLRLHKM